MGLEPFEHEAKLRTNFNPMGEAFWSLSQLTVSWIVWRVILIKSASPGINFGQRIACGPRDIGATEPTRTWEDFGTHH